MTYCRSKARIFLLLLLPALPPALLAATPLPPLPGHADFHFAESSKSETLSTAKQLEQFFDSAGYTLAGTRKEKQLPQVYVANLPADLKKLTASKRESLFIRLLLPVATRANNKTLAVRNKLTLLAVKQGKAIKLSPGEQQWLTSVATNYQADPNDLPGLLDRVDIVPTSLILAQAIDESGWGTSYFSITNNTLFGQRLLKGTADAFIFIPKDKARVATFASLYQSIASYLQNLNANRAFTRFRTERAASRRKHGKPVGVDLAGTLLHYSDRGQIYVDTLRELMRLHKLDEFDNLKFGSHGTETLIEFKR